MEEKHYKGDIAMDATRDRIIETIISEHGIIEGEVRDTDKLNDDYGFDSLRIVGLIVRLEDTFDIVFDEADLDPTSLITFKDLHETVMKYVD